MTALAIPDGRCSDCTTAKPPAGATVCQACRMLRILGRPVTPDMITEHKEEAA